MGISMGKSDAFLRFTQFLSRVSPSGNGKENVSKSFREQEFRLKRRKKWSALADRAPSDRS
jgi:hypothetical protein